MVVTLVRPLPTISHNSCMKYNKVSNEQGQMSKIVSRKKHVTKKEETLVERWPTEKGEGLGRRLRVQKMGIVGELRGGGGHGAKVATCHMATIFKVGQFNQK